MKKHKKSADEVNLVPWDVRARAKAIDDRDEKKTGQARIGGAKSAATATAGGTVSVKRQTSNFFLSKSAVYMLDAHQAQARLLHSATTMNLNLIQPSH